MKLYVSQHNTNLVKLKAIEDRINTIDNKVQQVQEKVDELDGQEEGVQNGDENQIEAGQGYNEYGFDVTGNDYVPLPYPWAE